MDRLEKIRLLPDVIPALLALKRAGFALVMVTNQDGLGTPALPQDAFDRAHRFTLDLFASQGIDFDAVFICPHFLHDACGCRKPKLGLVEEYLKNHPLDATRSYMVGDRDTDLEFARNIGIDGLRVRAHGNAAERWPAIAERILGAARRARTDRKTRETHVVVDVDLSREAPSRIATGIGFFDHMLEQLAKHGGFALTLEARGDLHIDEHHTVEDTALALGAALREALGDKSGIGRYGFVLAMDEAEAHVALDLSGRPFLCLGRALQSGADRRTANRAGAAFLSVFVRHAGRDAAPARERGELASHGRILLQRRRPSAAAGHPPRRQRTADHQRDPVSVRDIVILACGGANIASLKFALERLEAPAEVSSDPDRIRHASHVILPGVGAAVDAMTRLRSSGLDSLLPSLTQPVLGICLGMQLLHESSEEGPARCLGVIPGATIRLAAAPGRPVPHMGWNTIDIERPSPLLEGLGRHDHAYFVHSYAVPQSAATLASCRYGAAFSACVAWRNFYGVQFHPERSAAAGARVLRNFIGLH